MRDRVAYGMVVATALALSAGVMWRRLAEVAPPSPYPSVPVAAATIGDTAPPPTAAEPAEPPRPSPPPYVRLDPASGAACGPGMALVDGVYCPFVGHRCTSFADEDHDVCRLYAPEVLCEGRLQQLRYCIDIYEYPNLEGVYPAVMADFNDASRGCAVEGKRLCTTSEWEFACEGPAMWPYPYGLERDAGACNIDRPHPEPNLAAFSSPQKVSAEVARLDQRVRSGEMSRCVSPFGVRDMTGNVDEWAVNVEGKRLEKPYRSALKGGYWGPVRDRCRPMTSSHNEWFSFYQAGFRCCKGPADGVAATAPPPTQKRPRRRTIVAP